MFTTYIIFYSSKRLFTSSSSSWLSRSSSSMSSSSPPWFTESDPPPPPPNFCETWASRRCKFSDSDVAETGVLGKIIFPPSAAEPPAEVTTTTDPELFVPRDRFRFRFGFENPPDEFCAPGDRWTFDPSPWVVSCRWRWAFCRNVWSQREQLNGRTSSCIRMWTTYDEVNTSFITYHQMISWKLSSAKGDLVLYYFDQAISPPI